jgi:hypothetical protein
MASRRALSASRLARSSASAEACLASSHASAACCRAWLCARSAAVRALLISTMATTSNSTVAIRAPTAESAWTALALPSSRVQSSAPNHQSRASPVATRTSATNPARIASDARTPGLQRRAQRPDAVATSSVLMARHPSAAGASSSSRAR